MPRYRIAAPAIVIVAACGPGTSREAVARGEDVEDLGDRRQQGEADAERIELPERPRAGHHQRHPEQRDAEGRPAGPIEPLAEPDRRYQCDAGGVEVEDEQRQRDRDPLEGDEGGEVEDRVRAGRGKQEPAVTGGQRPQRHRANADRDEAQHDEGCHDRGPDGGAPRDQGQRIDARVGGEAAERAKRPEAGGGDGNQGRADEVGALPYRCPRHRAPIGAVSSSAAASSAASRFRSVTSASPRSTKRVVAFDQASDERGIGVRRRVSPGVR